VLVAWGGHVNEAQLAAAADDQFVRAANSMALLREALRVASAAAADLAEALDALVEDL
jgi:hypothetical protein